MIFHKWNDIYDKGDENFFIMFDNSYIPSNNSEPFDITKFNSRLLDEYLKSQNRIDFIEIFSDIVIYLILYKKNISTPLEKITYIFKKNKLYLFTHPRKKNFSNHVWHDEYGNRITSDSLIEDIEYNPFVFIHEKDQTQANRYLKLSKINLNKT